MQCWLRVHALALNLAWGRACPEPYVVQGLPIYLF
jgi:hypothetical protein